ncbi:anaerobic ribonucleoside triphosphate reductase activating protein [Arcobacter acticola]|uniref:Anaerobic ribonucleoside triphosphate reductase activating protein n=1 Tax=Arcobacter acticola TaxID=1849015 RepID=A0A6M8EGX2_9BACT|nr:anaerobic ribonucleoside-triphosphate reductase activating protein [Arcobacter acticola]QKE28666.1 anaerobic ribonucleoside triphosphate reductase activating protein [Arcobacter acticola]
MNQKIVYNITKFTTTDYVGHLSCIIWFVSCNFRCLYCYNDNIVYTKEGNYTQNNILDFLKTRIGLLDSVVLSGGEATVHNVIPICKEIKKLGLKIKLDTNATNLPQIKKLIELNLLDYIAIDFKAPKYKFKEIVGVDMYDNTIKTIQYLISIDFTFELRTTINKSLLDENDINSMIETISNLGYKNIYYLQNFLETSSNIGNISKSSNIDKSKINTQNLTIQYRN